MLSVTLLPVRDPKTMKISIPPHLRRSDRAKPLAAEDQRAADLQITYEVRGAEAADRYYSVGHIAIPDSTLRPDVKTHYPVILEIRPRKGERICFEEYAFQAGCDLEGAEWKARRLSEQLLDVGVQEPWIFRRHRPWLLPSRREQPIERARGATGLRQTFLEEVVDMKLDGFQLPLSIPPASRTREDAAAMEEYTLTVEKRILDDASVCGWYESRRDASIEGLRLALLMKGNTKVGYKGLFLAKIFNWMILPRREYAVGVLFHNDTASIGLSRIVAARRAVREYMSKNDVTWFILGYASQAGFSPETVDFVRDVYRGWWPVTDETKPHMGQEIAIALIDLTKRKLYECRGLLGKLARRFLKPRSR